MPAVDQLEIFMPLKKGSLMKLLKKYSGHKGVLADAVLCQMLQALEYLDHQGIVHRDVKPGNILYERVTPSEFHFYLADFGFAVDMATEVGLSSRGTDAFMAPEVRAREDQTTAMDVWSLFGTYIYVLDVQEFRSTCFKDKSPQQTIVAIATQPSFEEIQDMVAWEPKDRPSARKLLGRLWGSRAFPFPYPNDIQRRPNITKGIDVYNTADDFDERVNALNSQFQQALQLDPYQEEYDDSSRHNGYRAVQEEDHYPTDELYPTYEYHCPIHEHDYPTDEHDPTNEYHYTTDEHDYPTNEINSYTHPQHYRDSKKARYLLN